MRHGKKFNHLGRKVAHRKAMLSNMACSLIEHKRINTTVAKAKALRQYVEPLLTKSKTDSTHSRRTVFKYLQSKDAVTHLFRDVAPKIGDRPGGYTRIIRTGNRLGDNAEMCMIELVDFNELMLQADKPAKKTTRRSRRGAGAKSEDSAQATASTEVSNDVESASTVDEKPKKEAKPKAEAKSEKEVKEAPKAAAKTEAKEKEESPEAKKKEAPKKEDKKDDADQKEEKGDDSKEEK